MNNKKIISTSKGEWVDRKCISEYKINSNKIDFMPNDEYSKVQSQDVVEIQSNKIFICK